MKQNLVTSALSVHTCRPPSPAERGGGGTLLTKSVESPKLAAIGPPADTPSPPSDKELLRRFREGDRSAGDAFAERHYDRLKRVQRRKTRFPDRADDLVQETFLRFFKHAARHSFDDAAEELPAHTLFSIAGRAAADAARQERKERNIMENLTLRPRRHVQTPHAVAMAEEAARQVKAALAKLPPALRETAVWHFLDDLSVAEIHERTGIPKDALRQRIVRAKKALTELLSEYWWERQQAGTK